jgi:hypothetical protein
MKFLRTIEIAAALFFAISVMPLYQKSNPKVADGFDPRSAPILAVS